MNDALAIAKINARTNRRLADAELLKTVLNNPLLVGLGALLVNHTIYKTGFYDPNTSIPRKSLLGFTGALGPFGGDISTESGGANMHDSIALFIMVASIVASNRSGAGLNDKTLKVVTSG